MGRMLPTGALLLPFLFLLTGCTPAAEVWRFEGFTMGTSYHVTVVDAPAGLGRATLQSDVDRVLARIDDTMSTWREDSEISRFNRAPVGEWFPVAAETHAVLAESGRVFRLSAGSFDVTVAPLLAAWGFGPAATGGPRVPQDAELEALAARVGAAEIELDGPPHRVRKNAPREIELSAIAPGYAVDLVATAFAARGVANYMVEIGGEVRTAGSNPERAGWRIGVEQPDAPPGTPALALVLSGESVSTSGDYREFFESGGRRYSHTIDPRTRRPVEHGIASVTVLHASCMTADALATAIMVLGPEAGMALAERERIPVYIMVRSGDGFAARSSKAFEPYLGGKG
jgi:FAD:protein FMN transferase